MLQRIPMIKKWKGFKQVSFNTGIYRKGLYLIESGGSGVLIKKLK